jgi:uncharacterized protein DUF2510
MTDDTEDIVAGWYLDDQDVLRWWDGEQWTDRVHDSVDDSRRTAVDRDEPEPEPDHRRRTWLTATVVGLLTFFLGMGIGGRGSTPDPVLADDTASSGATTEELDQREAELEARDKAQATKESELKQREQDLDTRESQLQEQEQGDQSNATTIDDGDVEVGIDVQPGRYVTPGPTDPASPCTFRVTSDAAGTNVIRSKEVESSAAVTLEAGQYFSSENCDTWELQ